MPGFSFEDGVFDIEIKQDHKCIKITIISGNGETNKASVCVPKQSMAKVIAVLESQTDQIVD